MKKGIVALIVVAVLVLGIWVFVGNNDSVDSNSTGKVVSDFSGKKVMIDSSKSSFEFTAGKVVGKAHIGTFENWGGAVYMEDGDVIGIEGVAKVNSVKTDSVGVDKHLQNEDFFDAENYPEIKFMSTNVDSGKGEITGVLEIHGTQNKITVPASFEDGKISSEFTLDADMFNFRFEPLITEIEVRFDFFY